MKSSIRFTLFALLISACGGDRESPKSQPMTPTVATVIPDAQATPAPVPTPAPVTEAKLEQPAAPAAPTKFDDALAQGREMAKKGDNAGAIEMFESAIKLDKKKAEPHMELARLYISAGERGKAIAAANKAVKLAPLSSVAWNTKGRAELARFDYDAAIEAFTKAVELNRDNVWAWNNLGYTELTLKKYDEAVEHLTEATTRKGAEGYMFNNLGTALEQLGKLDEAREAYEAGGKLGSQVAMASRKRLEGVESIAIAQKPEKTDKAAAKTFEINEDGDTDEDKKLDGDGSGSGSGSGSAEQPGDKSTM